MEVASGGHIALAAAARSSSSSSASSALFPSSITLAAVIQVIHGLWTGAMQPRSGCDVEIVEQSGEEAGSLGLVVVGGVDALADEDGDELDAGFEEPAAFAHDSKTQSRAAGRLQ